MIPSEPPPAGTVIRYGYLWKREAEAGRDEGTKERPVALILARPGGLGECVVLPITHSAPVDAALAIEIPGAERARLGLDGDRCWIVLTEFNAFVWPGVDLRPVPGREPRTVIYGALSRGLHARVVAAVQTLLRARRVGRVPRT